MATPRLADAKLARGARLPGRIQFHRGPGPHGDLHGGPARACA